VSGTPRVIHCLPAPRDSFVYVGRAYSGRGNPAHRFAESPFHNPFRLRRGATPEERAECISKFETMLDADPELQERVRRELQGAISDAGARRPTPRSRATRTSCSGWRTPDAEPGERALAASAGPRPPAATREVHTAAGCSSQLHADAATYATWKALRRLHAPKEFRMLPCMTYTDTPGYVQLAVRVPRELHRDVKLFCVLNGTQSIMEFVQRALVNEIARGGGLPKLPGAPKARRCSTKRAAGTPAAAATV
jgi:hypothetical protein